MIHKIIEYIKLLHHLHTLENERANYLLNSKDPVGYYRMNEASYRYRIALLKEYLSDYWKR